MNIIEKRNELLEQESDQPERWWWLSFADPYLPTGTQFLGVSLVKASGFATATTYAHLLGINPGGEIQGHEIPDGFYVDKKYQHRLLTRKEAEQLDAEFGKQIDTPDK